MRLEQWAPWVLSVVSLPGVWLLRRKRRVGWLCTAVTHVCFGAYNVVTHQWGFVPINAGFCALSLSNHRAWRTGNDNDKENDE